MAKFTLSPTPPEQDSKGGDGHVYTIAAQVGSRRLLGWHALLANLAVMGVTAALVFLSHPSVASIPMWISAALWIAFIAYWSAMARHAATPVRAESRESRRVHERLLNGGLLLLLLPIPFLRGRVVPRSAAIIVTGFAVQIGCGLLGVWARRHLGRYWSGAISTVADHQLVRSGPYRVLRHPIYTAWLGVAVGSALVSGEWHALLGLSLVVGAYARKIRHEERHLHELFGDAYGEYKRASWALVPGVF